MALLLCLMILTLSVGSSTAWAVESELSDTYVLSDDVMLLSGNPIFSDNRNVFSSAQLEVVKGLLKEFPFKHYVMAYSMSAGSYITYYVVICDVISSDSRSINTGSGYLYEIRFYDDYAGGISASGDKMDGLWYYSRSIPITRSLFLWNVVKRTSTMTYFQASGNSFEKTLNTFPFSDCGGCSDISDGEGVRLQYATLFSLVVFFVYDRLRALWRSIRGRDT